MTPAGELFEALSMPAMLRAPAYAVWAALGSLIDPDPLTLETLAAWREAMDDPAVCEWLGRLCGPGLAWRGLGLSVARAEMFGGEPSAEGDVAGEKWQYLPREVARAARTGDPVVIVPVWVPSPEPAVALGDLVETGDGCMLEWLGVEGAPGGWAVDDLLAFRPEAPARVACRRGTGVVGRWAAGDPVRVHRDLLGWIRAGGRGVAIIDRTSREADELRGAGELIAEDEDHAEELYRWLRAPKPRLPVVTIDGNVGTRLTDPSPAAAFETVEAEA